MEGTTYRVRLVIEIPYAGVPNIEEEITVDADSLEDAEKEGQRLLLDLLGFYFPSSVEVING